MTPLHTADGQRARAKADTASKRAPTLLQAKVWANPKSKVYHCPDSRYYGKTKGGEYVSEAQARGKHYKAASGKGCT